MFKAVKNSVKLSQESSTALVWSFLAIALSLLIVSSLSFDRQQKGIASSPQLIDNQVEPEKAVQPEATLANHYPYNDPMFDEETPPPFPFAEEIKEVSEKMDVEPSLIYAITKAESGFRTQAKSGAGAFGLMQVVAKSAGQDAWQRVLKADGRPSQNDLKDPYTNLLVGSAYVKLLNEHYFDHIKDAKLRQGIILAAYNWGPSNVKKMLKKGFPKNMDELHWSLYQRAPKETYRYVRKVLRYKAQFEDEHKEHV